MVIEIRGPFIDAVLAGDRAALAEAPMRYRDDELCVACGRNPAGIMMHGYARNGADIALCTFCAQQLARKLLEDICDLLGDRHG